MMSSIFVRDVLDINQPPQTQGEDLKSCKGYTKKSEMVMEIYCAELCPLVLTGNKGHMVPHRKQVTNQATQRRWMGVFGPLVLTLTETLIRLEALPKICLECDCESGVKTNLATP